MFSKRINPGYLYAILCIVFWSFIPIVSRLGQSELDNFQLLFWSNILSLVAVSVIFISFTGVSHRRASVGVFIYSLFLGGLGCSIYYLFLYYGYANGNGIEVLIVQYSWPLQMILLSNLVLRESLQSSKLLAVIAGFGGIIIIITKGKLLDVQFSGVEVSLFVLAGSFCFALFSVLSKRSKVEITYFAVILFVGGVMASAAAMLLFSEVQFPNQQELLPVFLNGIFINGISYILWILALKRIPATSVAVLIFVTPLLSTLWLVIFFDEELYSSYLLGGGIVIISSVYCLKKTKNA